MTTILTSRALERLVKAGLVSGLGEAVVMARPWDMAEVHCLQLSLIVSEACR